MDSQNSQSVHTDESNREKMSVVRVSRHGLIVEKLSNSAERCGYIHGIVHAYTSMIFKIDPKNATKDEIQHIKDLIACMEYEVNEVVKA